MDCCMHSGGFQGFSVQFTSLCNDTPGLSRIGIGIISTYLFEESIQQGRLILTLIDR